MHCARTGNYTLLMAHAKRGRQAMEAMGILPRATGVAVHDAWAPYDTYAAPATSCAAHALRELQAASGAAPHSQWCRATQAAGAIAAMQQPVRKAASQGRDAADPAALAAACATASTTTCDSPATSARHRITTEPRATSGWPKPKQNVSGCLLTMTGACQFRAIRTYLSTAAKHGHGSFDALVMLTEGEPWMPAAA